MEIKDQERIYIHDRTAWREWLEKNHSRKTGAWLVFFKKQTGKPSLPYEDAVEEALCFGWIDSLVKRVDDESYIQKFTPRKSASTWSASNKKRVQKMIRQGRMTPAGMRAIDEAKRSGSWKTLDKVDAVVMIPELKTALARNRKAREQFERIPLSQKKQFLWWITSAKREETKQTRIRNTVLLLAEKKAMSDLSTAGRRRRRGQGARVKSEE
jgi:uncharacterized protein YdeI (YjbR/CyaY-like superfamily)